MIRVLIADDEPPIVRELQKLIMSAGMDFSVVQCVINGEEAIAYLESETVDVIFTDINMPVADGFQLLSYVKQNQPNIICVILTGFSEFSYAKQAISLGVEDYLLKPVDIEVLYELLGKIKEKVLRQAIENASLGDVNTVCREEESKTYLVMLCQFGGMSDTGAEPVFVAPIQMPHIEQMVLRSFQSQNVQSAWGIKGDQTGRIMLVASFHQDAGKGPDKQACAALSTRLRAIAEPLTLIVTEPVRSINQIHGAILRAKESLYREAVIGHSKLVFYGDIPVQQDSAPNSVLEASAIMLMRQYNLYAVLEILRKICKDFSENKTPQIAAERTILRILSSLSAPGNREQLQWEYDIHEAAGLSNTYAEFYENIQYLFENSMVQSKAPTLNVMRNEILLEMNKYIEENFNKPISMKELAKKFGFVPSYLTKTYRDYKGISPLNYITKLRIERAKVLIRESDVLLVRDVSQMVGYDDPLYFSKLFRKETGFSPSEYKLQGNT